jgi:hypothetical protein
MGLTIIKDLDGFMGGELLKQFQAEFDSMLRNVYDVNTDPEKVRSVTITIKLKPTKDRSAAAITTNVKASLAPRLPVAQIVLLDMNDAGEIVAMEKTAQIPGQQSMDGTEQREPNVLSFPPVVAKT